MIRADFHIHSDFSGDSDAPAAGQVEAGIAAGMQWLCMTDHHDPGYGDPAEDSPELLDFTLDLDRYYPQIRALGRQYGDRVRLLTGIELGLRTDCAEEITESAVRYPWDFIIGSTHVVDGADPYFPFFWEGKSPREAIRRFYEVTLENILAYDCFQVYGHLDYIIRYIPAGSSYHYRYQDFSDLLDEILRLLIARGKGIECNTAGFKYGLGHPNPEEALIRRYAELGGEILTIGSDAHRPEHVAHEFRRLPALLSGCGIRYYTIFKEQHPQMLPVDQD